MQSRPARFCVAEEAGLSFWSHTSHRTKNASCVHVFMSVCVCVCSYHAQKTGTVASRTRSTPASLQPYPLRPGLFAWACLLGRTNILRPNIPPDTRLDGVAAGSVTHILYQSVCVCVCTLGQAWLRGSARGDRWSSWPIWADARANRFAFLIVPS